MKNSKLKTKLRQIAAFIALAFLTSVVSGQPITDGAQDLKFGKSIEREIVKGDARDYRLTLRGGQVLFVELSEKTYNVKISLIRAADKTIAAQTDLGGGFDRENLVFAAPNAGVYFLRVEAADNQFGTGDFRFSARLADALTDADKIRVEALRLMHEAADLQKENTAANIREAIARREQALILWQNLGDKYWEGRTLDRLGTAHNALFENNKAVDYLNRTLQIVRESGDKTLEAATLNGIGSMTNGFGEYAQAIEFHSQALQIFQKLKNKVGIMSSQNYLGNAYVGLKDYAKANDYFQKNLAIARKDVNKDFEAACLYFLGTVLDTQNEKPKAFEKFNQALALWKEINNSVGIALALSKTGSFQNSQGKNDEALPILNEALRLSKSEKIRWLEAEIYFQLSILYNRLKKISEAIEFYKKSLVYHQEFKDRPFEIIITGAIATLYENLPDYREAIKYAETALAIEETVPEKWSEDRIIRSKSNIKNSKAMSLQTLARISFNSEDSEKALQYYYQVIEMFDGKDDKDSKQRMMDSLGSIAQIHQYRYEWDKALENYSSALAIANALEDNLDNKVRKILTLNSIGLIYKNTGEKKKSLEFFEKALEAVRLIPDRDDFAKNFEATILNNIGLSQLFSGETKKAFESHNEAAVIQEKIKDIDYIDSLAITYGNLSGDYSFIGENEKAIELRKKSLELYSQAPQKIKDLARNRTTEATMLNNFGYIYKITGDFRKALEYYNQALNIATNKKREDTESTALNNIALIYQASGEPRKALQNLNKALEISKRLSDKESEATVLNNIGIVYSDLGDEPTNIKYLNQALEIAEKLGDKERLATCLNNLGRASTTLSEYEKASSYFNRALTISRETGNKSDEAISLNNFAILYSNTGERGEAIEYFEKALTIVKEIGAKSDEAIMFGNIAADYLELGEYEKALEYREKSLKTSREIGDKSGEIYQLNGIGSIYRLKGEKEKKAEYFKQALIYNEQALKLSRESENKYGEFDALLGTGKIYTELNEPAKALPYLTEALDYAKKNQNRFLEDGVHFALGTLHEKNGAFDKAAEEYQQTLTVARTINDKDIEAKALKGLMSVWKTRGNDRLAIFYGKQSVNKYQELRGSIRNLKKETQDVFRDKITDVYRELADLLIEAKLLPEAGKVLAMLKQQEAFDFIQRDGSEADDLLSKKVFLNNDEAKSVAEYARLADVLIAKSRQKIDLENKSELSDDEKKELKALTEEVDEANAGVKLFFKKLEIEFARKNVDKETISAETLDSLQSGLKKAGPGVVLISTYLLPERYRVIITTGNATVDRKTEYKTLNLNGQKINKKIQEFNQALQNPKIDPRPMGKELYDIFIKPLENDLAAAKARTILWSLDGNLRYIPIGTLYDGSKYLAERYENVVVTLAVGRILTLFVEPSRDKPRILGLGVSKKFSNFSELPGVPLELQAIINDERNSQENKGILPGIRLLDSDFTDRSFADSLKPEKTGKIFNFIHLATHFRLGSTSSDSGLLLGNGEILSFYTIDKKSEFNFNDVDLLTLSACETGVSVGDSEGGEVESLGLLVQRKGAKSVLATLWKVADASTAILMSEFYRLLRENPRWTKSKALQEAQKEMISGKLNPKTEGCTNRAEIVGANQGKSFSTDECRQFAHPYYWSPFVLIGNWK